MKDLNQIKVVIDGEIYELSSEQKIDHIQSIAVYIDEKIKDIYRQKPNAYINQKLKTLFICLNIADDLFKEKEANHNLSKEHAELSSAITEYMRENQRLSSENDQLLSKVEKLQTELYDVKKELKEFIDNFERR